MDLGVPLIRYHKTNISSLREAVLTQSHEYWEIDRASRMKLAGDRPGNAVFLYNDVPDGINRNSLFEAQSGIVNVLRYSDRPLFSEIEQTIDSAIKPVFPHCNILRVQLAELPPGRIIRPHVDLGILAQVHRLHIPLITHPDVQFIVSGKNFFLEEGVLYNLNNTVRHSVVNNSAIMRIHLMVDMMPQNLAKTRYHDSLQSMKEAIAMLEQLP